MNFLEQLTAEWYEYNGYFVRQNVKFGKRKEGGWRGEMDVIAYNTNNKTSLHIETSTDSNTRAQREKKFKRKFSDAQQYYEEIFHFKSSPKRLAIVSFRMTMPQDLDFGSDIEIKTIPQFIREIVTELSVKDPRADVIPESYPLLRAIQFSAFFGDKAIKRG
ncbi:hypothetical protein A3I30_00060 [Candidatus Azambacteria bacterium RIFCSPLOWO2_02_FULL_44_14]|uniref:Uncharacterized protein n=1 Tax=Candidatus Azambacteria bacterium RIFCSPLOWO2_02_FULL_44_14 TaxID=1797306 RepID=A0A1F5CC87_9BACT|nr:MAG: hypothetical protein A3I30_00060 [Candidatus Azambacteria bacterium RIFCSPLOWO2_02_FULL_44_14]